MKKLLLLGLIGASSAITAQTVTITPELDNSIFNEDGSLSNATGRLFSGTTNSDDLRRALIQFDVDGAIPAGATIVSATLTLNCDNTGPGSGTDVYDIHPVTTAWGEGSSGPGLGGGGAGDAATIGDATWTNNLFGSSSWTTPGGDFGASLASTTLTTTGSYSWSSAAFTTQVQSWLDTPGSNFGLILIGNEGVTGNARRFGSDELGTAPTLEITYALPLTVTCQDINVYLDAAGTATIVPGDLDGGSTGVVDSSASKTTFDCSDIGGGPAMVISAVYDGPLSGGTPKGVEFFIKSDIADLSVYGFGSANNGGGTDGEEFTFPAVSATAGDYIYVSNESTNFTTWFGFAPDYTSSASNINGDDAIELFKDGIVIDVFGVIDLDGTGEPWDYVDGWAYRNDLTGPDGSTFVLSNWTFSGANALDGETTNATATTPVPVGTHTSGGASAGISVWYIATNGLVTDSCVSTVTVLDTLPPVVSCVSSIDVILDATGTGTLNVSDFDAGTTDNCGLDSVWLDLTTVSCADSGMVNVKLYGVDIYGNVDSCTSIANVIVDEVLTVTVDNVTDETCPGVGDGGIEVSVVGGTGGPYDYDWDNDGTGDFDDSEDIASLVGGDYDLMVKDANGCYGKLIDESIGSATPVDTSITVSGFTLSASASVDTYQWYDCTSMTIITGETDQDFTAPADGDYACIVTVGACTDTSYCYTLSSAGEFEKALDFEVYPNPTNDNITVSLNGSIADAYIEIIDVKGSIVFTSNITSTKTLVDIADLNAGVYMVRVVTKTSIQTKKIIIER